MNNILLYFFNLVMTSCTLCLADRSANARPWWSKRSYCFSCNKTLTWIDLIPVLSVILLQGRCRHCLTHFTNWVSWASLEGLFPCATTVILVQTKFWQFFSCYLLLFLAREDWQRLTCSAWLAWFWVFCLVMTHHQRATLWIGLIFLALLSWFACHHLVGSGDIPIIAIGFFSLNTAAFLIFLILASALALAYLAWSHDKKLPFIPFLLAAYLLVVLF